MQREVNGIDRPTQFSFFASAEGLVALLTCPIPTIVYPKEVDFQGGGMMCWQREVC